MNYSAAKWSWRLSVVIIHGDVRMYLKDSWHRNFGSYKNVATVFVKTIFCVSNSSLDIWISFMLRLNLEWQLTGRDRLHWASQCQKSDPDLGSKLCLHHQSYSNLGNLPPQFFVFIALFDFSYQARRADALVAHFVWSARIAVTATFDLVFLPITDVMQHTACAGYGWGYRRSLTCTEHFRSVFHKIPTLVPSVTAR